MPGKYPYPLVINPEILNLAEALDAGKPVNTSNTAALTAALELSAKYGRGGAQAPKVPASSQIGSTVPQSTPLNVGPPRNLGSYTPSLAPLPSAQPSPSGKSFLGKVGDFLKSPGGRNVLAQIGGALGRGNPRLVGAAMLAGSLAGVDQRKMIREALEKGLPLHAGLTAGLGANELDSIVNQFKGEKERTAKTALETTESVAKTDLARAQTSKLLSEPGFAEETAARLKAIGIQAGVQRFMDNGKEKSFYFDGERLVPLGESEKREAGQELTAYQRIATDMSAYRQATNDAASVAERNGLGKIVESRDPVTGEVKKDLVLNKDTDPAEYAKLQASTVANWISRGLIKNPAYYNAQATGVPLDLPDGKRFTGEFRDGKPIYVDAKGKYYAYTPAANTPSTTK